MDDISMTLDSPAQNATTLPQRNEETTGNVLTVRRIPFTPSLQTFYTSRHSFVVLACLLDVFDLNSVF
jgi:hypothetical protein